MIRDLPLLEVQDLRTHFFLDEGTVHAVDGVDFAIWAGKTLGVVGESGCGKSVTARSILRIVPRPGRIVHGRIIYNRAVAESTEAAQPIDLTSLDSKGREIRSIRGREISMVFQEPMTSLSPVHTIGNQITEVLLLHQQVAKKEARRRTAETLARVGMPQPADVMDRYPHELSGGMRQRAMIAMALACRPSLLIADEPTTALDVTTEAQILALIRKLQGELGMAVMLITHDLGVIAQMADHVIVMYLGQVVEEASVDDIFYQPGHPYTRALLRSIPRLGRKSRDRLEVIEGSVPDPYSVPTGCRYYPRCECYAPGRCDAGEPSMVEVAPGHRVRCCVRSE